MSVSDPSPCPEAVDFLCFLQSRARQCSTFLLARAPRFEKIDSLCPGRGQARLARAGEGSIHKQSLTCILIARCARLPRSASLKAGSVEGSTRSDFFSPRARQRSAVKGEKSPILSFSACLA